MTVNDGKGLYDSQGLCDTLCTDLNEAVKDLCSGHYLRFCDRVMQMVQKIVKLKQGIKNDLESKDKIIEELKRINDELMEEKTGLPVERGANDGTD